LLLNQLSGFHRSDLFAVGFSGSATDACRIRCSRCIRAITGWFSRQAVRIWGNDWHVCGITADFCI